MPAPVRDALAPFPVRTIAEYLFERLGAPLAHSRHVQVQLTFEDAALRRVDLHIGPIRGTADLDLLGQALEPL